VPSKVAGRTVVEFQAGVDVWSTVDEWAQEFEYVLTAQDGASRLYQKGQNFLVIPQMVQVTWTGAGHRLEAWVRNPTINRILTLGLAPSEMVINSGKFVGVVARNKARKDVNILLERLGVPPIE
jgi:hypothetical protein